MTSGSKIKIQRNLKPRGWFSKVVKANEIGGKQLDKTYPFDLLCCLNFQSLLDIRQSIQVLNIIS